MGRCLTFHRHRHLNELLEGGSQLRVEFNHLPHKLSERAAMLRLEGAQDGRESSLVDLERLVVVHELRGGERAHAQRHQAQREDVGSLLVVLGTHCSRRQLVEEFGCQVTVLLQAHNEFLVLVHVVRVGDLVVTLTGDQNVLGSQVTMKVAPLLQTVER